MFNQCDIIGLQGYQIW